MRRVAKAVGFLMIAFGLVYGCLIIALEWQSRTEDRAILAKSFSDGDGGMQVLAQGWDNRTLIFVLPEADPTKCDAFVDSIKNDKPLTDELRKAGFNRVACMQAKADLK